MSIRPEDFSSDTPPPRTIGTECEYNMQPLKGQTYNFVNAESMAETGILNHGGYFGSEYGSGRAYFDVGHLEFDTAEAVGPASAAVEDLAGIDRLSRIIKASGKEHGGLYRVSGTYIPNGLAGNTKTRDNRGRSSGYHENYLLPRSTSEDRLTDQLLPTALAIRVWAMSGTLRDKYVLSQKVWGTGGAPIERSLARRTDHGNKPMIIIPPRSSDADTLGADEWARIEVRMADPGLSLVNRFANFAAFSLTIRLIEQQRRIGADILKQLCLKEPLVAARHYAGNLSMRAASETLGGKSVTALDAQESFLELFEKLQDDVALPEDEQLGIVVIRSIIDGLRQSSPRFADYSTLARLRAEFAPKHQFVSSNRLQAQVKATNKNAMQRVLLWDRVLPVGNGMKYWEAMTEVDPVTPHIHKLAERFGISPRAQRRAAIVDARSSNKVNNWSNYYEKGSVRRSLGPPIGD